MYKVNFLIGLVVFFLIDNSLALKCYNCTGKSCLKINHSTNVEICNENGTLYENKNVTQMYCIHVKYRVIDDIRKADRFCHSSSCDEIKKWDIYKTGIECERCKTDLCNNNLGVNFQSWPLPILIVFTTFKLILS